MADADSQVKGKPEDVSDTRALLADREQQILRLLGLAQTNAEITERLSITVGTVKKQVSNLYERLGATSRIDDVSKGARLSR